MSVPLSSVPYWWLIDGIGHVLACHTDCHCGECDTYLSLCGMSGSLGEWGPMRPDAVCSECRKRLEWPALAMFDLPTYR